MGFKRSYKCPDCNYKVLTSAGTDRGMRASTNTFVCTECEIIMDRVVTKNTGMSSPSMLDGLEELMMEIMAEESGVKPENKELEKPNPKEHKNEKKKQGDNICPTCEATELELWDSKNKPCPKCGTKLVPDPDGMIVNWD